MAEREITEMGEKAVAFLRERAAKTKYPMERFFATTLARRAGGEFSEYFAAAQRIAQAQRNAAKGPAGGLDAEAVESILTSEAGGRLVEFVALRLLRDQSQPASTLMGQLLYVDRHWTPAVEVALKGFLRTGAGQDAKEMAVEILSRKGVKL
jgi:hypothetical protein